MKWIAHVQFVVFQLPANMRGFVADSRPRKAAVAHRERSKTAMAGVKVRGMTLE